MRRRAKKEDYARHYSSQNIKRLMQLFNIIMPTSLLLLLSAALPHIHHVWE